MMTGQERRGQARSMVAGGRGFCALYATLVVLALHPGLLQRRGSG